MSRRGGQAVGRGTSFSIRQATLVLALAAAASLALSLLIASGRAQEAEPEPPAELGVEWAFRPDGLRDLIGESEAIVVAQAESVRPGPEIAVEGGPGVPTELVGVRILRTIAGHPPPRLTLHRLGQGSVQPEGSPAYEIGGRYLLFARRRLSDDLSRPNPDGTWIAVAPDGRLRIAGSGRLQPLIDGQIGARFEGDTVDQAATEVDSARVPEAGE